MENVKREKSEGKAALAWPDKQFTVIFSTMEQYLSTVYLDMLGSSEINGASLSAPQSLFKTVSHSISTLQEIDGQFSLSRLH